MSTTTTRRDEGATLRRFADIGKHIDDLVARTDALKNVRGFIDRALKWGESGSIRPASRTSWARWRSENGRPLSSTAWRLLTTTYRAGSTGSLKTLRPIPTNSAQQ